MLVVSPDGHHGVLVSEGQSEVFDVQGNTWLSAPDDVTAFDDLVFIAGTPYKWDRTRAPQEYNAPQTALVRRIDGERFLAV